MHYPWRLLNQADEFKHLIEGVDRLKAVLLLASFQARCQSCSVLLGFFALALVGTIDSSVRLSECYPG